MQPKEEKVGWADSAKKANHLLFSELDVLMRALDRFFEGVIPDLIRAGTISYMSFLNIGRMIGEEIRENVYFNPFARSLNPEFDAIANPKISGIVKSIEPNEIMKYLSVVFIYLFRFMRFMRFIDIEGERPGSLNVSLSILILLKAEITAFQGYAAKAVGNMIDQELGGCLKSISYQFSMENRRVYLQELRDIQRKKASLGFRGKIENCHGILKNLTEQTVVQLAQHFRPEISGEEIFSSFVTKAQQSIRLREDIMVLHKFTQIIDENTDNAGDKLRVFESMRNYMLYFEGSTFRLLRHDDYEGFVMFFKEVRYAGKDAVSDRGFKKQLDTVRQFRIFLETTLRHIGNRAELRDKEVDAPRLDSLIGQHM